MGQRVTWIDLAKGLTILLVVFGHVIIGLFDSHVYTGTIQSQLLGMGTSHLSLSHARIFRLIWLFFHCMSNTK